MDGSCNGDNEDLDHDRLFFFQFLIVIQIMPNEYFNARISIWSLMFYFLGESQLSPSWNVNV